jgi:hypothetical protein
MVQKNCVAFGMPVLLRHEVLLQHMRASPIKDLIEFVLGMGACPGSLAGLYPTNLRSPIE